MMGKCLGLDNLYLVCMTFSLKYLPVDIQGILRFTILINVYELDNEYILQFQWFLLSGLQCVSALNYCHINPRR